MSPQLSSFRSRGSLPRGLGEHWCIAPALITDARATPLERVECASQRLISGGLILGDRIQGYLAKPDGAGPFPAVIGLHGCAGMHDTTKQRLADELVSWGYVILLVDSFATRGIEQACTGGSFFARAGKRPSDAYGALAFLARQSFVDPQRVAAVGFSQGGWATLWVAETNSFVQFRPPEQRAVPGRDCVLSSLHARRAESWNTYAHLHWGPG